MEIRKKVKKEVGVYKRVLYRYDISVRSMYDNEEERDMLMAKLLFYLIVLIGTIAALVVLAIVIF